MPWFARNTTSFFAKLEQIKPDELIFFLSFFKDNNGNFIEHEKLLEEMTSISPVPVYGGGSFMMEHGIAGGVMIDGVKQGRAQAEKLLQVLANIDAPMPPVEEQKGTPYLSYEAMVKFSLEHDGEGDIQIYGELSLFLKQIPNWLCSA
ncbi:hypothetical protein CS022_14305 [Veronia nyctiphanis]|uniref:Uncharacterized protein n=1 Tax=Veronia nyctiphanis TaxID=1278244 RepID=A0A4Q0YTW6_9GAMM|nr:hypothetical protein [Veronia nyctiphanis]RXJ72619.1 hypothetical protein CS022_14305 [Veronia nyctiphanis]